MNMTRGFGSGAKIGLRMQIVFALIRNHWSWLFVTIAVTLCQASTYANEEGAATPDQAEFFENKIRPLLVDKCYECHAGDEVEAGLWLDSKEGWQTGGDSGAAIIPGDLEKSLLIEAVRYSENRVSGMPPDSRLDPHEVKLLEQWVSAGAFDPRVDSHPSAKAQKFDFESRVKSHWSWHPIEKPPVPKLETDDWSKNDLDRFIFSRLMQSGLSPSTDADPLIWLRRVSFDLTGLPPTPDLIQRMEKDPTGDTKVQIVDELLNSDRFGEKWARHWLDLVRYADTYGHEFDYPIDHAHQYRDYVIRAFNDDLPYDQFIVEHIAGDLLEQPRRNREHGFNESILGTGFWYLHEATHAPTDVLQNEADIFSNQIDVFGKTFLGLTIACARCHDHKFDAISTADYYALQAFLESSCRQRVPLANLEQQQALAEQLDRLREKIADQIQSSADQIQQSTAIVHALQELEERKSAHDPQQWQSYQAQSELFVDFSGDSIPNHWSSTGNAFHAIDDQLRFAASASKDNHLGGTVDSGVYGVNPVGTLRSPTFTISSPRIDIWIRSDANMIVRVVIDHYEMARFQPLLFKGTILSKGETNTEGEFRWLTLDRDLKKYLGHQAYLEFVDTGDGAMAIDQIWMSNRPPNTAPPLVLPTVKESIDKQSAVKQMISGLQQRRRSPLLQAAKFSELSDLPDIDQSLQQFRALASQWKRPASAIAMADGTHQSTPIYIRGGHSNHGDLVEPRNLTALGGQSGNRFDLSKQIATIGNPLTARVRVNRVWHHLFGQGIVATVDDFGPQGAAPSHPALLDYLATTFAEEGWSLKKFVRRIVLSRTYGQASTANPDDKTQIATVDPTNRLLHRMNIRRLEAEMIRDGILQSAGTLSPKMFGAPVPTHRTPFMTGRGARASGPLDGQGRRTIYQAVYRNFLNPFLMTFDMPVPFASTGRRSQSNVPAQSLAMMNDPFVLDQARKWATNLVKDPRPPIEKIEEMILRAHGRPMSSQSVAELESFIQLQTEARNGDSTAAYADLAQSLWAMKAFLFLR